MQDQLMKWHYISFADKEFHGAVVIEAHDITDVIRLCNSLNLNINPGGHIFCIPVPNDQLPEEKWRNRLLSKAEVLALWPNASPLAEC